MAGTANKRDAISFFDVAVVFSGEEWELLGDQQRALYMEVMKENYEHFIYLGFRVPIILSWLQNRSTANGGAADQKPSPKPPNPVPAANQVKVEREWEDQTDGIEHPRNGAIRKSSKRVQRSKTLD
ncbi:zinc finger protein 747-like [Pyxicephalus adspersus]|uniref:zinc finger protein 747-like n=1 Tax=Pyxicephalus adspersus TaxID=30357 RepID=UPI003B59A519